MHAAHHPHEQYHNGQVVHYTRQDPANPGAEPTPYLNWVRSVCPWEFSRSPNEWRKIQRPRFTNEDLLAEVQRVPRLIGD